MKEIKKYLDILETTSADSALALFYGSDIAEIQSQKKRIEFALNQFSNHFSQDEVEIFSTPGRTEIGGNHTDHNHGRVLAGSVNLDSLAVAAKSSLNQIRIYSKNYQKLFSVDLDDLSVLQRVNPGFSFTT